MAITTSHENFRARTIKALKASAQKLIDNAEELVSAVDSDLGRVNTIITITLPSANDAYDAPEIEVSQTYISRSTVAYLHGFEDDLVNNLDKNL